MRSPRWLSMPLVIVLFASSSAFSAELLLADKPIHDVIDHHINGGLKTEKLTPAPQIDASNLARRLTIDLVGRIPAVSEVRAFVGSTESDKRTKLIDAFIGSPEFVEHQAVRFDVFITGGNGGIQKYLKTAFQENRGWDRMTRDILLGKESDPAQKEALAFLKGRVKDTDQLTNDVSTIFFGINVSCTKCHDHPLVEGWTQAHFYGMKSFFNRSFDSGGFVGEKEFGRVDYTTTAGEKHPAKLMFLTGTVIDEPEGLEPSKDEQKKLEAKYKQLAKQKKAPPEPKYSRREQLLEVALKPGEDHFFAKSIVNRVWHQMMGQGLVMPLDQMHSANPPSHPELMDWLARDMVSHGYDLRRLMRGIAMSQAYSRSSRWAAGERPAPETFAVGVVRPLTPWQYSRSLGLATTDPRQFTGEIKPDELKKRIAGSANAGNASLFEEPGENFQISANEALLFSNSDRIAGSYLRGGLFGYLKTLEDSNKLVEETSWAILSRAPDAEERKLLSAHLEARKDRREQAVQQVIWAMLTGTEFRFNY
jgi:hypothetical protein